MALGGRVSSQEGRATSIQLKSRGPCRACSIVHFVAISTGGWMPRGGGVQRPVPARSCSALSLPAPAMSSYPAYYGGGYQRSSLDAYRASPVLHRGGGGGRGSGGGGGSGARSYGFGPAQAVQQPHYGPELYGLEHAGLRWFAGNPQASPARAPLSTAAPPAAAHPPCAHVPSSPAQRACRALRARLQAPR